MARKRMIDPSFWEDEKLGTLEPTARLLFMGLISQADDDGRLKGHPSLLRSLIFPYDESITIAHIESWLILLADKERSLIARYEVDNQKYIWVRNFKKHQTINKPQKSKLPSYQDSYGIDTVVVHDDDGNVTAQKKGREVKEKGIEGEEKGISPSPSDILNNEHEKHITLFLKQYSVEMDKPYQTEKFFSYIGATDIEIIEAAIKKSKGKGIAYALATLEGMITDGVTRESLKPKVGDGNAESGVQHGRAESQDPADEKPSGWLPSAYNKPANTNVIPMSKVSG